MLKQLFFSECDKAEKEKSTDQKPGSTKTSQTESESNSMSLANAIEC